MAAWQAAVSECRRAGIRVVMITGDHPGTALAIARQAGFDVSAGAITGRDMAVMTDAELVQAAARVQVYARVTPEQKLRLVMAYKAAGEVVAMTGDGVNDAPALKAAHIGVAMGRRGTDVARESSALVLIDAVFLAMVKVGVAVEVSAAVAFVLAAVLNYLLCIWLLFRHRVRWSTPGELSRYAAIVVVVGLIDVFITKQLVATEMQPALSKCIASIVGLILNFLGRRIFVFPERKLGDWASRDPDRCRDD